MKKVFGDEFSFFGNDDDTLLPAGAALPGFATKPTDPVFAPSFLDPANNVGPAGVLTDAAQAGNSKPIAQNFTFIAPDVSPQRAGISFDADLISTIAHTSTTDSGAGPQEISPAANGNFWINEGPSPGINGQESVAPNNQINGAIQAIAVHPTNPNIMYVGSVNGGIWKTTNATSATPHWVPLTDNLASLSIGALEFDPTDATHQTLIAGIGSTSSYFLNDQFTGVLRSTDGGTTWSQLGTSAAYLGGENITSVAARGTTLLAAADNGWGGGLGKGLFRSTDSGATWTLISDGTHGLPNLTDVSDIVGDPLNSNVFYAAATGASGGVFKSTDTGLTWTPISGIGIFGSTTDKVELAVHHDATNTSVFATVDNGGVLSGVFRSLNGASFVALNVPSGGSQGFVHASIAADPANFNVVYVGFGGGGANYLSRIDASQPSGSQITKISGAGFGSPHVDPREMQIDASGNLILGTDGGLFRLNTPAANTGVWSAIVGDMSVFELHSIAYDHVSHVIMGGAQDNGTLFQLTPGGATWDHPGFGDGGDVVIDDVSLAGSGRSIRYFSSQNLGGWTRQVYDSANHLVSTTNLSVISPDPPEEDEEDEDSPIVDPTFTTPVELNNVNPARILVGGSLHIYESVNQGTTLTSIANIGVNGIGSTGGGVMVYGGFQGGVGNPDLIYAASGANVVRQTASGGGFTTTSPGGSTIRGITDNPTNWATVFAIDDNQIFKSTNAGGIWTDVTGNLTSISAADFRSIEYVHGAVDDALVVGTSSGVFYALASQLGGAASWSKFGGNMPDVIVYDLEYDAADNVLVAGTMGRGAWLVNNATINLGIDDLNRAPSDFNADGTSDVFWRDNATGHVGTWEMHNNVQTWHDLGGSGVDHKVAGIGDFNGDGTADLFWRNDSTGHVGTWEMHNNVQTWHDLGGSGVDHKVAGIGDFNGDQTSDVFWRNDSTGHVGTWEMHNNVQTWHDLGGSGVDHKVVGIGDFNGDQTADVLWRNDSSGHVGIWEMHNNVQTWHDLGGSGVDHKVAGIGDYNGDGTSDIFWRNDSSGHVGIWEMHNNVQTWHDLGGSGVDHSFIV